MVVIEKFGYIKLSDLLITCPTIYADLDELEEVALETDAKAETLRKEAEAKLESSKKYKELAKRKLSAVYRMRAAVGEKKPSEKVEK
jgi:hypothetical protein